MATPKKFRRVSATLTLEQFKKLEAIAGVLTRYKGAEVGLGEALAEAVDEMHAKYWE